MKALMHLLACAGGLSLLGLLPAASAASSYPGASRPLRIIEKPRVEFPPKLIRSAITSGAVWLYLDVDATGQLEDHLIVAYTHFEFANAVSRTVGRWRFEAGMVNGRTIASTVSLNLRFELNGVMVAERTDAAEPPATLSAFMFRARALKELDGIPRATTTVAPTNPAAAGEPAVAGRARVDFFIDEEGVVRMPVAVAADDERLGWAAVAAISRWRFEPPQRSGRPVLARASQVFTFSPEE